MSLSWKPRRLATYSYYLVRGRVRQFLQDRERHSFAERKIARSFKFDPNLAEEVRLAYRTLIRADDIANPVSILGFEIHFMDKFLLKFLFQEIFVQLCYYSPNLGSDPIIFDCGSNIGLSVMFFKKLCPNSRIIAFEPDPRTFEVLAKNVTQNGLKDITLHNYALGDHDGTVDFFRGKLDGCLRMSTIGSRAGGECIQVPMHRLSSYVEDRVDLLKLDVEGAEQAVLTDLQSAGALSRIATMHLEYHHHIVHDADSLSATLAVLERGGFGYKIRAEADKWGQPDGFQDIAIFAYRKSAKPEQPMSE